MRKAFKLALLATAACFIWYHFNHKVNPRDEDIDRLISPEDTLPYVPNRIDSGGGKDTVVILPRDTTPYKGNYIDVN